MSTIGLKYNDVNKLHYVLTPEKLELKVGDSVVVETERGKELMQVEHISFTTETQELSDLVKKVLRKATKKDLEKQQELKDKKVQVLETTRQLIDKYKLDMKLADAEFTIDAQKVMISFVCEDRVDFRDLVKELAQKLKMRIELKQIGSRDQAQIVGGIGPCGQEACCIRYLGDFEKVSIKMAKTQNLSLNPTKISGLCGRLMCCLAFENDHYAETSAKMPKVGSFVKTPEGKGVVIYNNLLHEVCSVKFKEDDTFRVVEFALEDLEFEKTQGKPPCKVKKA